MEQIRTIQSESRALSQAMQARHLRSQADVVEEELTHYEEQIKRYRAGELDETKMQKLRLHFGTRSAGTPVAVVRWGTYDGQQTVTGTLRTIAVESECAGMRAPAVIVVGEVVRLRERLKWFEASLEGVNAEELEAALAVAC
ncbi:MAG: hypothetical protein M3410_14965 [Acidobacteriota bacterium]|nr:hypothetical protein [Acidobacteriota bacterium]